MPESEILKSLDEIELYFPKRSANKIFFQIGNEVVYYEDGYPLSVENINSGEYVTKIWYPLTHINSEWFNPKGSFEFYGGRRDEAECGVVRLIDKQEYKVHHFFTFQQYETVFPYTELKQWENETHFPADLLKRI